MEEITMNMENPYKNLIGVIDLILQKTEVETDKKSFRIDLSDVRTNSIEEGRELITFLDNLKKKGALYDFERFTVGEQPGSPISSLFYYKFTVRPNKEKLIEERKRLINFDQPQPIKRSSSRSPENKGLIKKLELVKPKAGLEKTRNKKFEPPKLPMDKEKSAAFRDTHPIWLSRRDDDRTYQYGKILLHRTLVREVFGYIMKCGIICPEKLLELEQLLIMFSRYQREAMGEDWESCHR